MGPISLSDLGHLSPAAILAGVVVSIISGYLVPAREMRYWRAAFFAEQEMRRSLMDTGRATRDVLRALPEAPKETKESEEKAS